MLALRTHLMFSSGGVDGPASSCTMAAAGLNSCRTCMRFRGSTMPSQAAQRLFDCLCLQTKRMSRCLLAELRCQQAGYRST